MGIYQKMGRRWISLLLVFLMVFSLVPVDELMQVFARHNSGLETSKERGAFRREWRDNAKGGN